MGLAPYGNDLEKIPGSKNTYKKIFKKVLTSNGKLGYKLNLELIDFILKEISGLVKNSLKSLEKKKIEKNNKTS